MPNRDEPRILADLIRLAERKEREAAELRAVDRGEKPVPTLAIHTAREIEDEVRLIDQARFALHRYVIRGGTLPPAKPAPLNAWSMYVFVVAACGSAAVLNGMSPFLATPLTVVALFGVSAILNGNSKGKQP